MKLTQLLVLGTLLATAAFAQPKHDPEKAMEFLKKELSLTDEQVTKMKALREKNEGAGKAHRETFLAAKKAYDDAVQNSKSTPAELTQKFEAFQKLRDDRQRKKFAQMLEMRSILKPDQVEKFQKMKPVGKPGHGPRRGHR